MVESRGGISEAVLLVSAWYGLRSASLRVIVLGVFVEAKPWFVNFLVQA